VNLELTDDQQFFLDTTRRFLASEVPIPTVRALHDTDAGFERSWWQHAAELGWTSMLVSERAGGGSLSGRPVADAALVAEELGRACAPGPFLPVNLVAAALSAAGSAAQQDDVLVGLLAGTSIASWAFAEPGDRWNAAGIAATAEVDADAIVLDGHKAYVEAAPTADHLLVTARTGLGLTQVLVPTGTAGVTVRPTASIDLVRRFGEVLLESVRLPLAAVVGEVGDAGDQVERQLQLALVLQCASIVGALDRVFEFTLEYMGDRFAFGRPIASYQALKHRVADMLLWLESAKGTTDAAVAAVDARADDASRLVSVAKSYVGDKAMAILQECNQFHGGISQTWEHDLHLYLRRVTLERALYGTPEHHRERLCVLLGVGNA
jgi:alkylation response protein AidB-like acyl-CoA dehydrogenase